MDTSIEERFHAAVNVIRGLPRNGKLIFFLCCCCVHIVGIAIIVVEFFFRYHCDCCGLLCIHGLYVHSAIAWRQWKVHLRVVLCSPRVVHTRIIIKAVFMAAHKIVYMRMRMCQLQLFIVIAVTFVAIDCFLQWKTNALLSIPYGFVYVFFSLFLFYKISDCETIVDSTYAWFAVIRLLDMIFVCTVKGLWISMS